MSRRLRSWGPGRSKSGNAARGTRTNGLTKQSPGRWERARNSWSRWRPIPMLGPAPGVLGRVQGLNINMSSTPRSRTTTERKPYRATVAELRRGRIMPRIKRGTILQRRGRPDPRQEYAMRPKRRLNAAPLIPSTGRVIMGPPATLHAERQKRVLDESNREQALADMRRNSRRQSFDISAPLFASRPMRTF